MAKIAQNGKKPKIAQNSQVLNNVYVAFRADTFFKTLGTCEHRNRDPNLYEIAKLQPK